ncbi:hypothetical protein EPN52_00710 [bacterium]|nr:MAG: hypothetical protein EPN52_00710 [bacterium]
MSERREPWLVGAAAFVLLLLTAHGRHTPYDNFVLLADALAHGRVWIDWPGPWIDALRYQGAYYVIEAPLPALLLLPFVVLFGTAVNQTLLSIGLGAVALGAAAALLQRLQVPRAARWWLLAFYAVGTDLWWCAMLGDVWMIAHVAAVCFTTLALVELAGARRGWLVGALGACAALSRFSLVLALPLYAVALLRPRDHARGHGFARAALGFVAALAPFAMFWLWYNQARWGTFADIGYTTWFHQDQAGAPYGSPFALHYLGYELWSFFVQAPSFMPQAPWIVPSVSGVALTWTSPALIYALWARRPRAEVLWLWAATIVTAGPSLLYYVNGFAQYGMRHALDFEPFLFALMALAARKGLPLWARVLIVWSCAAGLYGVWYWSALVRVGS